MSSSKPKNKGKEGGASGRRRISDEDRSGAKPLIAKRHSLKAQRKLKKQEPQVVEDTKKAMFLKGAKTSPEVAQLLIDLRHLKQPDAIPYTRKNQIRPFEDSSSLEFFSSKNDCALFCLGSHTKKRPHNLTFGRFFENQLLDMIEVGISNSTSMPAGGSKSAIGSTPCFVFQGDHFEHLENFKLLKSILLDFFRGKENELLNLASLDHVIFVSSSPADETTAHFRHYKVHLKKSGSKVPRVELQDIGPSFDMTIRRTKFASGDSAKLALQQPKEIAPSKRKNITTNLFGQKLGTVHMHRQDFEKLQVKKARALKRQRDSRSGEGASETSGQQPENPKKRMKMD